MRTSASGTERLSQDRSVRRGARSQGIGDPVRRFALLWEQGPAPQIHDFLDDVGPLTPSQLVAVLRIDQRESWRAGERLTAEAYLEAFPGLTAEGALDVIRGEFLLRQERGENPELREYEQRFPAHAEPLRQLVHLHGTLAAAVLQDPAGASTLKGRKHAAALPPPGPARLPAVPGYVLLCELGRGGMGVVYKAWQPKLDRLVALKMIRTGHFASTAEVERFRSEALAVARLQHPNLVHVYDIGEHDGLPFCSLEYVDGGSLDERLAGTPQPPALAAQLVRTLAEAIHYAHEQGIVHRDLKPANILLRRKSEIRNPKSETNPKSESPNRDASSGFGFVSDFGFRISDFEPKVTDFGLAKLLGQESGHTRTGDVLGTPNYMAPEQAVGRSQDVGPATDIYSLGAILYELLTGRPPFFGETALDTLEQLRDLEPVPPSQLQPKVPRDLDTVCLKCLQKEPAKRYVTALALAEDLGRFLDGEPVRARPTGAWERTWKWARRRPAVATLLALVVAVTLTGLGLVSWKWYEAEQAWARAADSARDERAARGQANTRREDAERERHRAQVLSASLTLEQGIQRCEDGQIGPGLLWMARALKQTPEGADDLVYAIRANLAAWRGHFWPARKGAYQATAVTAVAFSPDGQTVLTGNWGNAAGKRAPAHVRLWDRAAWERGDFTPKVEVRHDLAVTGAAFHPDGKTFATASLDGTARLWETATGKPVGAVMRGGSPLFALAFSPDGRTLATAGLLAGPTPNSARGGEVRLWNAATGEKTDAKTLLSPGLFVRSLAWGPDGRSLAVGGYLPSSAGLSLGAFPPTAGERGAVGGAAVVCDLAGGKGGSPLLHADDVRAVAFHPDGKRLLTACRDGVVRFWDVRTGARLPMQLRHPHPVNALALSRDGGVLVAGTGDQVGRRRGPGEVRVWDVATGQPLVQPLEIALTMNSNMVNAVALSADGGHIAAASENGHGWLWTVARASQPLAMIPSDREPAALAFSRDGRSLLLNYPPTPEGEPAQPGEVRLFRTANFRKDEGGRMKDESESSLIQPSSFRLHPSEAVQAVFRPDGRRVLTYPLAPGRPHRLQLWDAASGKLLPLPVALAENVRSAAFSPDGRYLLTGGADGKVRIWDSTTYTAAAPPLDHGAAVTDLGFSPDGRTLFTAGDAPGVRLWSLADGRALGQPLTVPGAEAPLRIRFSADGQVLLTLWRVSGRPNALQCWSVPEGRPLPAPQIEEGGLDVACVHPQRRHFLTTSEDGFGRPISARFWDMETGKPLGGQLTFGVSPGAAAFHPSGRFLALGLSEGHARLWSVAVGKPLGPPVRHPGQVHQVAFSADGRLLATAGKDHVVRLWKVHEPLRGSPEQVRLQIEALCGQALDEAGGTQNLSEKEQAQRRQRLQALE
jgi:WD40 repeat protein/serine/threonine protein kinase